MAGRLGRALAAPSPEGSPGSPRPSAPSAIPARANSFVWDVQTDPAIFLYLDPTVTRRFWLPTPLPRASSSSGCPSVRCAIRFRSSQTARPGWCIASALDRRIRRRLRTCAGCCAQWSVEGASALRKRRGEIEASLGPRHHAVQPEPLRYHWVQFFCRHGILERGDSPRRIPRKPSPHIISYGVQLTAVHGTDGRWRRRLSDGLRRAGIIDSLRGPGSLYRLLARYSRWLRL